MSLATRCNFGLPREERLRGKAAFDLFFKHANHTKVGVLKCYYTYGLEGLDPPARISMAVVAPKKFMKRAHDRNRIKRLVREAYRLQAPGVFEAYLKPQTQPESPKLVLMFVYSTAQPTTFAAVSHAVSRILARIAHDLPPVFLPPDPAG